MGREREREREKRKERECLQETDIVLYLCILLKKRVLSAFSQIQYVFDKTGLVCFGSKEKPSLNKHSRVTQTHTQCLHLIQCQLGLMLAILIGIVLTTLTAQCTSFQIVS